MKQTTTSKNFILAAAISLGLASATFAQNANVAVPNPAEADTAVVSGQLGTRYSEVAYKFVNLKGPDNAHGFALNYNQPLSAGFDFTASYDWAKADLGAFDAKVQDLEVGVKAFSNYSFAKPYVLAAVGWEWQKVATFRDDSFTYKVGVGAEFEVAPAFVITPFVNFVRATEFNASEFEIGAKATYRFNESWSAMVRGQYESVRHDADTTEWAAGVIYRF